MNISGLRNETLGQEESGHSTVCWLGAQYLKPLTLFVPTPSSLRVRVVSHDLFSVSSAPVIVAPPYEPDGNTTRCGSFRVPASRPTVDQVLWLLLRARPHADIKSSSQTAYFQSLLFFVRTRVENKTSPSSCRATRRRWSGDRWRLTEAARPAGTGA